MKHPFANYEQCNHECVCSKPENCRPTEGCGCDNCEHDTRNQPVTEEKHNSCTWGNHCLSEWCCPNRIENMFCICARNFDEWIEQCEHDTRIRPDPFIEIADLKQSLDFYKKRCELLQKYQSKMRDPERKTVCDILANGIYHE
jgi:hypothetical protein